MIGPMIIPAALIVMVAMYLALNRPYWLLAGYLVAVPLFPAIPVGPVELSMLDLLALPALLRIIHNLSRHGLGIRGSLTKAFFMLVAAALISFLAFTLQQSLLSGSLLFRIIRLVEIFLPVMLASQIIDCSQKEKMVRLFLCGGSLAAGVGILMFMAGISLRESQTFSAAGLEVFRAAGLHGDSGSFGSLMGFSALISLWVLFYKYGYYRKTTILLAWTGLLCSSAGLFLSLSRGGIVLLAAGLVVLIVPLLLHPAKLLKMLFMFTILLTLIVPLAWKQVKSELVVETFAEMQDRIAGLSELSADFETVSSHRSLHWIEGLRLYGSNPLAWPFGLGYKSLKHHYGTLPDNNFNQALFETGLLGLIALLVLIGTGIREGMRQFRFARMEGPAILALWAALVSNMLSADVLTYWHNIPALFIVLIALGKADRPGWNGVERESTAIPQFNYPAPRPI